MVTNPNKQQQGLISIRELVALIAGRTEVNDEAAAEALCDFLYGKRLDWMKLDFYEWHPSHGNRVVRSGSERGQEALKLICDWGNSRISQYSLEGMDGGFNSKILDRVGFRQSDVLPLVEKIGDSTAGESDPAISTLGSWPLWKRRLAELEYLTDEEAAAALTGIDLSEPDSQLPYDQDEFQHLRRLIRRSCEGGNLPAETVRIANDGYPVWNIKHSDFTAWCDSRGIPYPLPGRSYMKRPGTDSEVKMGDQSSCLEDEVRRLRDELHAKNEELGQVTAECNRLKAEVLERKSRTSALKIIGGLIVTIYKLDIHSDRFEGIQAIQDDLERAGCPVDPKTLRGWIKEAAAVVPPPEASASKGSLR